MPVGQQFDIVLGGKGFMLARGQFKGRAWKRTGLPNQVQPSIAVADAQRNAQPADVDFVAAYDDFSGGYGHAYRDPGAANTVHWSENADLRWPNQAVHCQQLQLLPSRYASLNTQVEYLIDVPVPSGANQPAGAGVVLVTGHEFVGRLGPTGVQTAGSQFDTAMEFTPTQEMRAQPAVADIYTYIPSSAGFIRRTHNAAFTQSDVLGAKSFITAGNRLWRSHTTYRLQSTSIGADATNTANWGPTFNIGNQNDLVNELIEVADQVYATTPEGLYAGDLSGTFFNVLPEIRGSRHIDNGHDLTVFDTGIVVPHAAGVFWYRADSLQAEAKEIGPQARSSDRSPVQGRPRSVKAYGPWLYVGLWTGSQSYLQAGAPGQDGEYRWHVLHRLPHTARINRIHFDTITNASSNQGVFATEIPTRMWIATDWLVTSGTSPLYVTPIPRLNGNPLVADPLFTANYVGSARIDFGRDNRGAPETLKVLRRIDVNTDASTLMSGARYADVYYALDGGPRTLLGRAQTSPRSTLYFPSGDGSFVTCYDFELSMESFTGSGPLTPVYRSIVTHGAFLAEGTDEIQAVIDISGRRADRTGTPMRTAAAQIADLRSMAGGVPQSLIDLTGAQSWVTLGRGLQENEVYQEGSDDPEVAVTVRMTVQAFS